MQAIQSGFFSTLILWNKHPCSSNHPKHGKLDSILSAGRSLNIWDLNQEPCGSEVTSTKQQATESTAHEERTGRTKRGQEDGKGSRRVVKSHELRKRTETRSDDWGEEFSSFQDGDANKRHLKFNQPFFPPSKKKKIKCTVWSWCFLLF